MKQEDKELLLKDLCARLPYGVHLFTNTKHHIRLLTISNDIDYDEQFWINGLYDIDEVKPCLRPMSSMTEEEDEEFKQILEIELDYLASNEEGHTVKSAASSTFGIDFYNRHHFDYRGLIEKGLAIEAPEGMYKKGE